MDLPGPQQTPSHDPVSASAGARTAGFHGLIDVADDAVASTEIASVCPTGAISIDERGRVTLDRGRCILCGECVRAAPEMFSFGARYETAARSRPQPGRRPRSRTPRATMSRPTHRSASGPRMLRRSIHVRHIDCGSDGSEEWEIQALWNPYYDIQRLGFFLTNSPRHADVLLVTGPVTAPMRAPLQRTWEVMPEPKALIAVGTDACGGGLHRWGAVDEVLPVDVYVPGSPPAPIAIMHGLLQAVGLTQRGAVGMSALYAIAMALLAGAVPVTWLGPSAWRERLGSCCSAVGCVLLVIVGLAAALGSTEPVVNLGGWLGFGHSALRADGLAGIFLALTGITGAAVSLAYAELPAGRWLTLLANTLLLFIAVAIGSDNGFLFFLAWEAITVCVYLIASARGDREDLLAGYLTGGLAKIGGAALLAAFALLYAHTHSFSLDVWRHAHLSAGTRDVLFALFLTCFATKVGVLPLQGGLPAGYGSAPRLGAASLSVALCAGFYGLWRFEFDVLGPLPTGCGDALLIIAAVTAVTGITYALTQDDLRRFLGYSTVEHAGVALVGFAVALLGHAAHQPSLAAAGLLAARCTSAPTTSQRLWR